ncbi:50S ribosomal protein L23 [Thiofaba sp. EF100]|jgi:large subunit ribosomal protein L23|uniref:50S ribosomal protein L23 n=1 Tax=Thiofaba sp. EF100 TaxID=3121274 RepID=UPI003221B186
MNAERILQVLRAPHVTEKASLVNAVAGQHVFKVATDATKPEIKQAVETLFKVTVEQVRVVNVKPKRKRFRFKEGSRKAWKKAYVKLAAGQTIDYGVGA